jgi:hypothetical protein
LIEKIFPNQTVTLFQEEKDGIELYLIDFPEYRVKVLTTKGLSDYKMPVHEKYEGRENIELFVCLPSYWDLESDNENFTWPIYWLRKLAKHVVEKNAWFGPGHTIQCAKDYAQISPNMKQNHFILADPLLLNEELSPKQIDEKMIHFLSLIPIFGGEMDYKQAKGTYKLLKRFANKGISEKLDDFRESVLNTRMKFFR